MRGHLAAVEPLQLPVLLGLEAREIPQGTVDLAYLFFALRVKIRLLTIILPYTNNFQILKIYKHLVEIYQAGIFLLKPRDLFHREATFS